MKRLVIAVIVALAALGSAGSALADGDPGSDVLVYQNLFAGADSGLSVAQQLKIGRRLDAAARSGRPLRVAIIARRDDLGAVTGLWGKPRAYARFLGLELSIAYRGRLLVVMPGGLGVSRGGGHPDAAGTRAVSGIAGGASAGGLTSAALAAIARLSTLPAAGPGRRVEKPPTVGRNSTRLVPPAPPAPGGTGGTGGTGGADQTVALVVLGLAAAALALAALRRRRLDPSGLTMSAGALALVAAVAVVGLGGSSSSSADAGLASNPNLDPGQPIQSRRAPDFTLSDEEGRPVSLRDYRGKVVILAFNDSECTTICPLTTTAMIEARRALGPAARQVQLLGIDANSKSISVQDVRSYTELHGMNGAWHFLTGRLPQLRRVWRAYGVGVEIQRGEIDHTPALFLIDPRGRLRRLFLTQQSYAAVGQLGQLLAQRAAALLPGHPAVRTALGYSRIAGIGPGRRVTLPRAGGGDVRLGPGTGAHLLVFFATWDREVSGLVGQLEELNRYGAHARGLPPLTAVDEATVEPSPAALPGFLGTLPRPLHYPVAIDATGRLADGYGVQGQPWFVLTSADGRILWYSDGYANGWPSVGALEQQVRAALSRPAAPRGSAGTGAVRSLARGASALAAVYRQAGQLLGPGLQSRLRALRGHPVVVNVWASYCGPCRQEFGLLQRAAARFGRRVAFLGADYQDNPSDARSFLGAHPTLYPSYAASVATIDAVLPAGILGLPTTFFVDRSGRVVHVQSGQYVSQGTLDGDVQTYAR